MRSVPAPDLQHDSDEKVWESLYYGAVNSDEYKHGVPTLQLRDLERQTNASNTLVTVTSTLVDATTSLIASTNQAAAFTKQLVIATYVLCGVSFLLFVATVVQFLMNPSR